MDSTTVSTFNDASTVAEFSDELGVYVTNILNILFLTFMFLIGTVGNILIIGALFVHARLRVRSNIFIGNLAVADFCVTAIINPLNVVGVIHSQMFYQYPVICDAIGCLCLVSCFVSIWSIAAITLNRYIAICHSGMLYHRIYNRKTIPFIIAGIWIYCFFVDLPNFLGWGEHVFNSRARLCLFDYTVSYSYTLYLVCLAIAIPMFLVSFCYVRILLFAWKSKQRLRKFANTDSVTCPRIPGGRNRIRTTDVRLLRSVASTWVAFIIMWTPFVIVVLLDPGDWSGSVFAVAITLAHCNSSINSIIYGATNPNFREGYVKFVKRIGRLMCCGRKPKSETSTSDVTSSKINTSMSKD